MLFSTLIVPALAVVTVAAQNMTIRPCYTDQAKVNVKAERAIAAQVAFLQRERPFRRWGARQVAPATNVSIPVNWHTIQKDATAAGGAVSRTQITDSIDSLNNAFKQMGFTFVLNATTTTTSPNLFDNAGPETNAQAQMKAALRMGGPEALNVYTVGFTRTTVAGLLGYATFPQSFATAPQDDGVVINVKSLPGGGLPEYNLGGTLNHEAGHWLGLFHTFQGGCSANGDRVADTPPVAQPNFSCDRPVNSCPGSAGTDDLGNIMDYTPDPCKTGFSAGQVTRAQAAHSLFRAPRAA